MSCFEDEIVNSIRNESQLIDHSGILTERIRKIIYDQQLFKLFIPDTLNGRMLALPQALKIFEQAAWIDGNFGWAVTIGSGGGYFYPYMEPETGDLLYHPRNAVVAGSGMPSGYAMPTDGGYRVSGRWKYCSGAEYATLFTANCLYGRQQSADPTEIISVILRPEQVKIEKDWDAFGLKATGSHSIQADTVFVPEEYTFSLLMKQNECPYPIYRYPFQSFAETSFASVSLGIVRHLLDEAIDHAGRQRESWHSQDVHRYSFVMRLLENEQKRLDAIRSSFDQMAEESWEQFVNSGHLEMSFLKRITDICQQASRGALQIGQSIIPYMGMAAVMQHSSLNRIWRDLQTACQHAILVPYQENIKF